MLRRLLKLLNPVVEAPGVPQQGSDGDALTQDSDDDAPDLGGLFAMPEDSDDDNDGLPQDSDDGEDVFNLQGLFSLEEVDDGPPPVLNPVAVQYDPHPELKYYSHISYDIYVKEGGDGHPEVVAHDFGVPLVHFIQHHPPVLRCNSNTVRDGRLVLPGEIELNQNYLIAAEIVKKIARSMLNGLSKNRSKYSFFSPFDAGNILVSESGEVTFRGVWLVTPLLQLADGSVPDLLALHLGTRQNIMAVHDIIKDTLFSGNPPKDIDDLLRLMEFDLHSSLYCNHGSLAPIATYPDLFRLLYDYIKHVLPKEEMREILKHMPYVDDWKQALEDNELLMSTFNFNKNNYTIPTADDENRGCLSNEQRKALKALGLKEVRGQTCLDAEQIGLFNALNFLDFLRNRTSHRMETYRKWIGNKKSHRMETYRKWIGNKKLGFSIQGAERIAFVRFGRVVGYLQVRLEMILKLKALPIADFF